MLDGHKLDEQGIMKLFMLPFDRIIISTVEILVLLAIDDREVSSLHQIGELRLSGSEMLAGQLTVLDDRLANFLEEVKVLFLWIFTGYFISQLVEVEEFVNESESTLDVAIEFLVGLLLECHARVCVLTFCSLKLVCKNLNFLVQVVNNLVVLLRVTRIHSIIILSLHVIQGVHLIHKNFFDLRLQFGIFFPFFLELLGQVFNF